MDIKINSYIPITNVDGIGTRFAIWVQGCSLRCEGCANSFMWDFDGGKSYDVWNFIDIIKSYSDKIEGITWLGGEPTEQMQAVTEISKEVQKMGLSVILFSGYEYKELLKRPDFKKLANYVDILIDGRYEKDKQDFSRPWVGSCNQNYYFLSDRYSMRDVEKCKNKIEIRIGSDNNVLITGMGDSEKLRELIK